MKMRKMLGVMERRIHVFNRMYRQVQRIAVLVVSLLLVLSGFQLNAIASYEHASVTALAPNAVFTGEPSEWASVPHESISYVSSLSRLKAVQRGQTLYLLAEGTGMNTDSVFFIDSDYNDSTGEPHAGWSNGGGIDYKLVNSSLYHYELGNWVLKGSATVAKSNTAVEAAVDLQQLGIALSHKLRVGFLKQGLDMLPEAGQYMLNVDAAAALFAAPVDITVDGSAVDWAGISPTAVANDGVTRLYAAEDSRKLYVLVTGKLSAFNDVYIDVDKSNFSGFVSWAWPKLGADYMLENGVLYKNSGSGWNWSKQTAAGVDYVSVDNGSGVQTIEMSVPLATFGLTKPKPLWIAFNGGGVYAPAPGGDPAAVIPSLPKVVVDGSDADWVGLSPISSGQGVIRDLYAFVNGKKLYMLSHGTDFSAEKNLFINIDNNPATGSQGWQYSHTGADVLVQNGLVYVSTGPGWSWAQVGKAESVVASVYGHSDQKVLEQAVDLSGFANLSDTVRIALGVGNDYAPAIGSVSDYPPVLGLSGAPLTIDGQTGDWSGIDNQALASGTVTTLNVTQDQQKLYLFVQGQGLNTQNVFYIDSDGNGLTGYHDPAWPGSGYDYKIDRNTLYRFDSGAGGIWEKVGSVYNRITPNGILVYLYVDSIDHTPGTPLSVAFVGKDALRLPIAAKPMLSSKSFFLQAQDGAAYSPRESFDVLNNPFMGWVAWSHDTKHPEGQPYSQPHSLVYTGITWRELEPVKGEYDWAAVEKKYQFAYWTALGKKINLRIVLDLPTTDPNHMDIPDWLYQKLVQKEGASGVGKWYNSSGIGAGFAPNYSSTLLIAEHDKLIRAIAARYDRDPRIAFVQIGSLGHWGEFHNYPETDAGKFPSLRVSDQYVQVYIDSFKNKLIGMRKPFPIAAQNGFGLFNDVFGDRGSTQQWLGWARDGWSDIGLYVEPGQDPAAVQAASRMPDFWKMNYSGGEFTSGNPLQSLRDEAIMESLGQARDSHTSWLGPSAPVDYVVGHNIDASVQENLDTMLKTMGYRFVLESVKHPQTVLQESVVTVNTVWKNKGVAPFYMKWPLAFALADQEGTFVEDSVAAAANVDIRQLLPGKNDVATSFRLSDDVKHGTYTLLVGILDPATGKPGVQLAIGGKRSDGWYALDTIVVDKGKEKEKGR